MCSVVSITLCNPTDCSPPSSSACRIFQARMLEWVAISYSRGSSRPRDWTHISCISCFGRWILYHCVTWEAQEVAGWMIKTKYYFNHPKICFSVPFIIILGFFLLIPHCLHKSVCKGFKWHKNEISAAINILHSSGVIHCKVLFRLVMEMWRGTCSFRWKKGWTEKPCPMASADSGT